MSDKHEKDIDQISGVETTGHEWDGIKELNNPLPKWWLYTFYATILFAIGYTIVYPSWPFPSGDGWTYVKGTADYAQRTDVAEEIGAVKAEQAKYVDEIRSADFAAITANDELHDFALQGGKAAFGDNCAGCHGSGAQGFTGFPNLNDDDWLWGGTIDAIYTTIQHGIRSETDPETRLSDMPRFLADGILDRDGVLDVTEYVLSLSGKAEDEARVARGAVIYEEQCVACHMEGGAGSHDLGAPKLSDAIWLYGGDRAAVYETVAYARRGVMPAWAGRLDEATIKQLALYVYSLGGGEAAPVESMESR
ncbi:cytochrome-c oxidase, cbb3-type subunit III [Pseudokordiimonas caeni]|uniref:cytochrome-c oxidase, cbb3-type subunit III n=1 Tax=Pseudokordiimonas caeni TaxID=2997908 RepID=UPI002810CE3D|nr:cytochrome-c oxidase, cbb3-type subunit III [Pseudokordiimonas caeni]